MTAPRRRRSVIKDQTSLKSFHRAVHNLGWSKLQDVKQLSLAVCPLARATGSLAPRTARGGKQAKHEAENKELRTLVYGEGRGHGREGSAQP